MANPLTSLDWSLIQAFVAVADTGSLSAAARALSSSQPTVGRQVRMLETRLGTSLFNRQPRGMALSAAGLALIEPARAMQDAAGRMALVAAGSAETMAGTVRITASEFTAHHHLPPIVAQIRLRHPEITVEIVANDSSQNLLFREADIALRMYRPDQLEMVAHHLGDLALGLYATPGYLDRRGRPATLEDMQQHDLIGYDRSELIIRGMQSYGWMVSRDDFPIRCDHHTVYWELIRAGCGIGFAQTSVARHDPKVERILPGLPLPGLPLWLTAHEALRRTPRVAAVWDMLVEGLKPVLDPPGGPVFTLGGAAGAKAGQAAPKPRP
ncbi:LysR family transcriptional regulator [Oceaniglobus trochenteri]|uniref:LysR family transcriptional regulator n=1 Tax=Oceaniglobus trochenteri TaxID=2763260 RepID=UPI001CFFF399|nr:LysR family transcriptional regulator [Oceaniglobus trochenteri]